ncbi:MAG: heme exporter protein CcmB [Planctomycetales bacterium]|nr:heme exporter protein CcmB [Planctomycetales bacterium]
MNVLDTAKQVGWLLHKDLVVEYRSRLAWPVMFLLGIIVTIVFSLQTSLPREYLPSTASTMLWLATMFAGLVAIDRTGIAEDQDGCSVGLSLYPLSGSTIYVAKFLVNLCAILVLLGVLVPIFSLVTDLSLAKHVGAMVIVAVTGSAGLAAVGTLVSNLTRDLQQRGAVLSVLLLPLLVPLILAASEATRLIAVDEVGTQWWRWVQLLVAFAIDFATVGIVLSHYLREE